jgi:hypothetical protein
MNSAVRNFFVPAAAAIVTIVAAMVDLSADRQACPTAKEFSDSLASNRSRVAGVDSALSGFDLTESARPIGPDTASGSNAPNRLERRIVSLRMQGVTRKQIGRWLREDVHLTPLPGAGALATDSSQLQLIHRLETDSAYVHDLRKQMLVTSDLWHDMTVVPPLAARWTARCSAYRTEMAVLLPSWAAAMLAFFAWGWWRRKRG